ncbi:MAG: hypothetical protein DMF74_15845 [Acidobacteria bacterium]|nr:MAG: hypothetical protein DMF74_15845 [Acidobacteriota bacterium]
MYNPNSQKRAANYGRASKLEGKGLERVMVGSNKWQLFGQRRIYLIAVVLVFVFAMGLGLIASGQNSPTRSPSDVVREFYKAMREHRFKDAWSMTIYKPAVEGLTAQEMEELRVDFEEKAAKIPEQVEITGEQISANTATVFVKVPVTESTPQITSEPVTLVNSAGVWIIGSEADQAEVKKKGRRFFLDALIDEHQSDIEDLLKRRFTLSSTTAHSAIFRRSSRPA